MMYAFGCMSSYASKVQLRKILHLRTTYAVGERTISVVYNTGSVHYDLKLLNDVCMTER